MATNTKSRTATKSTAKSTAKSAAKATVPTESFRETLFGLNGDHKQFNSILSGVKKAHGKRVADNIRHYAWTAPGEPVKEGGWSSDPGKIANADLKEYGLTHESTAAEAMAAIKASLPEPATGSADVAQAVWVHYGVA